MTSFSEKQIVLGVTGGIAAYKAAIVASQLVQAGARVEVIMTEAAQRFIQPLTFSAITHTPVHTDLFSPSEWEGGSSGHVSLAAAADLVIVAPATAATIARLALGLSEDLIGLVALSTRSPLLLAPAMEDGMYHHPATRQHLASLADRGVTLVGPDHGRLASGAVGIGRMAAPERIVDAARNIIAPAKPLRGKTVVVTAGGTREPLDPVRYIGNRSSGRMGYALASAALAAGARVILISGPVDTPAPPGATLVSVETAIAMQSAVTEAVRDADVLIMAAAVADYRPETIADRKIKKHAASSHLDLRLVRNPDIVAGIVQPGLLKIGFAAETEDLIDNAAQKLKSKGLHMIVANDAATTIGARDSEAVIITAAGALDPLPRMSKDALAAEIVHRIAAALAQPERQDS
jgi:phosphopantothenoylcysteine decarboxylase/phosphopantothenate--cysteine ligase